MSWRNICPMDEKVKFIAAIKQKHYYMSEICEKVGISRKTGYKWLKRYENEGPKGLYERSRARIIQKNRTSDSQLKLILDTKQRFQHWGPKKIKCWLETNYTNKKFPAASTIGNILQKHAMVEHRKKRKNIPPYTKPFINCTRSNDVWSADFKGQFHMGNKSYCYPLTITDNFSRYIIACDGYLSPTFKNVKKSFIRAFKEFGLPIAIKTDNGTPFSSVSAGGLSQLSIWWIKLGICPERIAPGHPEQNGRHERMHRTLKKATTNPPQYSIKSQNNVFEDFINEFNNIRPHEALANKTPASIYTKSKQGYPSKIPEVTYPDDCLVRKVRTNGCIKFNGNLIYVSKLLYGEPVGIVKIKDDCWNIRYSYLSIGMLNEKRASSIRA